MAYEFSRIPSLWEVLEDTLSWTKNYEPKTYQIVELDQDESILYVNAAGYKSSDNNIDIQMDRGHLTIIGKNPDQQKTRIVAPIKLRFTISPEYQVKEASLENGLLAIRLVRQHKTDPVKIPIV